MRIAFCREFRMFFSIRFIDFRNAADRCLSLFPLFSSLSLSGREYFHLDFLSKLSGVSITQNSLGGPDGTTYIPPSLSVTGKVRHTSPIQTADYAFLAQHVDHSKGAVARVSIPSPTMLHFRGGRKAISEEAYPDLKEFFEDLAKAYRQEIDDLYKKGCRYIQVSLSATIFFFEGQDGAKEG
jgi:methionine synthase II (cobalamin-independent)